MTARRAPRHIIPRRPAPHDFATPCAAPSPSVGALLAVPVFSISPTPTASLTPLNATLTELPITIANKRLTEILSPLNATLTKKQGVSVDTADPASLLVGAQFIAPFSPRLQLKLRLSPVTSHESPVTHLPSRVTAS